MRYGCLRSRQRYRFGVICRQVRAITLADVPSLRLADSSSRTKGLTRRTQCTAGRISAFARFTQRRPRRCCETRHHVIVFWPRRRSASMLARTASAGDLMAPTCRTMTSRMERSSRLGCCHTYTLDDLGCPSRSNTYTGSSRRGRPRTISGTGTDCTNLARHECADSTARRIQLSRMSFSTSGWPECYAKICESQ